MELLAARDREDQMVRQAMQASIEEEQIAKAVNASIELAVMGGSGTRAAGGGLDGRSGVRSPVLRVYVDATASQGLGSGSRVGNGVTGSPRTPATAALTAAVGGGGSIVRVFDRGEGEGPTIGRREQQNLQQQQQQQHESTSEGVGQLQSSTAPGTGRGGVGAVRSSSSIYRTEEERIQEALRRSLREH